MVSTESGGLRLAVNTQTPLVRFRDDVVTGLAGRPVRLADLREPDDFKFTTGGVTRMLTPLLRRWLDAGLLSHAQWVAMAAGERAPELDHDGIHLSFVGLHEREKKGYAQVKERLWALLNSNPSTPVPHGEGGIPESAWAEFDAYQRRSAQALRQAAERMGGLDLLYVHDFQQVGVAAAWEGPRVPRIFHLHTPFPSVMPRAWADYVIENLRLYDAVVVSTRRYAENLRAFGLDVPVHVIRPFIDPADYKPATAKDAEALRAQFRIADPDRVILNVGRMDPMKGQDRLIRAMPIVLEKVPDARLVLVGNGSFSSSKKGGLGLSKGQQWRAALEALTRELHVTERVTFTGHLGDDQLPAAYEACSVFSLPSTREGFGLAAIEAWRHGKPVVVSDRAGVSELVEPGVNGHAVDAADVRALADALVKLLLDPSAARQMGEAGKDASEEATLPVGARHLERLFDGVLATREARAYAKA